MHHLAEKIATIWHKYHGEVHAGMLLCDKVCNFVHE